MVRRWTGSIFDVLNTAPMMTRYILLPIAAFCLSPLAAQLNILTQFNPSNTGGMCGIAYNSTAGEIMVIGCSASTIDRYAEDGTFISSATMVGESANDVDIDMSPADLTMNGTFVAQGQLLLVNGETDAAEIYAIDPLTNQVIDTLAAGFGNSHVVGGSYHPQRGTFFLVQDNVPGGFFANRVAEIDAATGDTIQTFSIQPYFDVNYGDLDISPVSGHLFIVSSNEATIAEFTPDGVFVQEHALPVGVSNLSGIALDNDLQGAWVCDNTGEVYKLGNFPVAVQDLGANGVFTALRPNPATAQVVLELWLPKASLVSIILHDVSGRTVRELHGGTIGTGSRALVFDVSGLETGCYTVVILGDGIRGTERLVIER